MDMSDVRKLGTLSTINFGSKHVDLCRAHANPDVKARAAPVEAAVTALETAQAPLASLAAVRRAATKKRDDADKVVEDRVRGVSHHMLGPSLCNGNRRDPAYTAVIPGGTLAFLGGPDRAQVAVVRGVVSTLRQDAAHPAASLADALDAANESFAGTLAPMVNADTAYRAAEAHVADLREAVHAELHRSVRALRDLLDGDEAQVDALFPRIADVRRDDPKPDA